MQRVSRQYKESMKSPFRERAHILILLGLINKKAQLNATASGQGTYYSNFNLFKEIDNNQIKRYATFEENYINLNEEMYFLPKVNQDKYINTGFVSSNLKSRGNCELMLYPNAEETDIKGLTIDFGNNYPTRFKIETDKDQVLEFRNNQRIWVCESVIHRARTIRIVVLEMKYPHNRLRVHSVKFGYGITFNNDHVLDSVLTSYASPICESVPQIDFEVQIKNFERYFDIDNPESAINYLEIGHELNISYGYQLPNQNKIEWVQGGKLLCSSWESDDKTAVIRCQDSLRNLENDFNKGKYSESGRSFYSLIEEVLQDAKVEDYYIEPALKNVFTKNPIPRVKHKEALQILANACRCSLMESRLGQIQIKTNYIPSVQYSSNGETYFSRVGDLGKIKTKESLEYATFSLDRVKLDPIESQYRFIPKRRKNPPLIEPFYVSRLIANSQGMFSTNPMITIDISGYKLFYGVYMDFNGVIPKEFRIHYYNNSKLIETKLYTNSEWERLENASDDIQENCNKVKIEFIKTKPQQRIFIKECYISYVANFRLDKTDMLTFPKAIKQEEVKEVNVPVSLFQKGTKEETLISTDVEVKNNQTEIFYFTNPSYDLVAKLNDSTNLVEIVEWSNYFVKIKYKTSGKHKLTINGYVYKIAEQLESKTLNPKGKTIKWKNPMISNSKMAKELAEWLGEYYSSKIEYVYETRGNPELDVLDIIKQENDFVENMKVNVYQSTLRFKNAFNGSVTTRKMGE